MTEIDGESYWDGGIFINTPLAPAINALEQSDADDPDVERELFYVEVHRRVGRHTSQYQRIHSTGAIT